MMTVHKRK